MKLSGYWFVSSKSLTAYAGRAVIYLKSVLNSSRRTIVIPYGKKLIGPVMVLAIIGSIISCGTTPQEDIQTQYVAAGLGEKVDDYLTRLVPFGFSGAALVARGDEVLLNKGYGLAISAGLIANTSQTIFSVGSITKQFTSAAIMKLEMMGKLNTGDSISKYFENVPDDKQGVTLHHLLTHTSGINDDVMGDDFEIAHRDETMRKILDNPLRFAPGEDFEYSNMGYSMLAAIVEIVSGIPYEQFLSEHLFAPSGMSFTGYRLPDFTGRTVAHWYTGVIDNGIPLDKDYPYWNYIGNGGILSTTDDMLKWHRALMGEQVLSTDAKKKLFTPFLNDYAYGWDVLDTERGTLIQHDGGSMLGCAADFKRFVDSNIVIMLFSNVSGPELLHRQGVRDKVADIVFGDDVELPYDVAQVKADLSDISGELYYRQRRRLSCGSRGRQTGYQSPRRQSDNLALYFGRQSAEGSRRQRKKVCRSHGCGR